MTRTEIENYVKARCSFLTSHKHIVPESSGRKMKFKVTEQDIEHLVSDALYRAREVFNISDIWNLHNYFNIREDKKQHTVTLYSITKEIKNATRKNESGIV